MPKFRSAGILLICFFILTGCSIVTKLKEKLSSKKENSSTKESIKEAASSDDMVFYNKYIEVMNKIQDPCENIYKDYISSVPDPGSVTKNSLIIPVSMQVNTQSLERLIKEYQRSLYDGGELSKLKASANMQTDIEGDLKILLPAMEEFYDVSLKISNYYFKREYVNDLSKTKPYDEEIKSSYNRYKTAFDKFSSDLKKYKPKRKVFDTSSISNPDERSSAVMLNAYGDILDAAELFYESFEKAGYKGDLTDVKVKFYDFESTFKESGKKVQGTEFTERYKFMKYNFEDYFSTNAENFIEAGKTFIVTAPDVKSENTFRKIYNDVINEYNKMINSHNTNVATIQSMRSW